MSRISKNPVTIPSNVEVKLEASRVIVKGPNGTLEQALKPQVQLKQDNNLVLISSTDESKFSNAMSGTIRSLVANMVKGVAEGFEKKLLLVGVGYRAQLSGDNINLNLGFSHPVSYPVPQGIKIEIPTQTEIIIKGIDKQQVGQVAAEIRSFRPPEPYKGKGVRYSDETVILKEAKKK
ncbi:50S ribosomal protein L6 [Nitrosomonas aestuarii]|uniref:50S ribosomal protein L6 n=1 Tax=Nitrosomonas aestuarii TaxID=52441 RepID=UPI000D321E9F|nr:50S ribosomal protein L6 [Nitrosomonas aestuarii]PTN13035.1 LSU ribosomal protein L6P [Nitrosomonas aestuarii]